MFLSSIWLSEFSPENLPEEVQLIEQVNYEKVLNAENRMRRSERKVSVLNTSVLIVPENNSELIKGSGWE